MLTLPRQDLLIVLAVQGRSTAGPSSRAAATSELAGRFTVPASGTTGGAAPGTDQPGGEEHRLRGGNEQGGGA